MSRSEVTLKDIAKTVGKSVAAVSKALNDHGDISPATREQIKEAARQMGYRPNITARRLQKQRTETLGLVVPTFFNKETTSTRQADPFFTELLSGVADQAATQGFDLLVSTRAPGDEECQAYQRLVTQQRVDGLVIAQPRKDDWRIGFLQEQAMPFVVVGHFDQRLDAPGIFINTAHGIQQGVDHLVEQGRNKLALIPPPPELLVADIYLKLFNVAVGMKHGVQGQTAGAIEEFSQKAGYRSAQILLADGEPPDAIFACHDLVALGAMAAVQDQGFEVGSDIAVIGFGDILLSEHAQPPLTSIHQPTYTMGQQACQMMIDHITNQAPAKRQILIEPWLVVRQSSGLALWL